VNGPPSETPGLPTVSAPSGARTALEKWDLNKEIKIMSVQSKAHVYSP